MKVLFIAEAVTWSQVVRLVLLANQLDPLRFDVTFAAARFDPLLFGSSMFRRERIRSISPETVERRTLQARRIYDAGTLTSYVDEEQSLYRRIRPDVVVSDLRWSTTVSAPALGIPLVSLVDAYWFRALADYPVPAHPFVSLIDPAHLRRGFDFVLPRLLRHFATPLNVLRSRHGLRPFDDLRDVLGYGDALVFPDDPLLVHSDRAGTYLGPLCWAPQIPSSPSLERVGSERPLVYVTMGSSGDLAVVPKIVEALGTLDVDIVLASARRALPPLDAKHLHVVDVVAGDEMCARASLVVCSGGASTAWQALVAGTPVVGIPANLDACLAMSCVTAFGAGIELRSNASVDAIRAACVKALASETIRGKASTLAASAARIAPHARFHAVLEEVAGFGRAARRASV